MNMTEQGRKTLGKDLMNKLWNVKNKISSSYLGTLEFRERRIVSRYCGLNACVFVLSCVFLTMFLRVTAVARERKTKKDPIVNMYNNLYLFVLFY